MPIITLVLFGLLGFFFFRLEFELKKKIYKKLLQKNKIQTNLSNQREKKFATILKINDSPSKAVYNLSFHQCKEEKKRSSKVSLVI